MGYKTKSSINKIEKGYNDVSQSKVVKFAEALHTTEAYLMGWTDDPDPRLEKAFPFFTKGDLERLSSIIPTPHFKMTDGVIDEEDSSEEDIEKAIELYKHYQNAIPQIQEAVRNLLKVDKPDS